MSRYPDIKMVGISIWIKLKLWMNLGINDIFMYSDFNLH